MNWKMLKMKKNVAFFGPKAFSVIFSELVAFPKIKMVQN